MNVNDAFVDCDARIAALDLPAQTAVVKLLDEARRQRMREARDAQRQQRACKRGRADGKSKEHADG